MEGRTLTLVLTTLKGCLLFIYFLIIRVMSVQKEIEGKVSIQSHSNFFALNFFPKLLAIN